MGIFHTYPPHPPKSPKNQSGKHLPHIDILSETPLPHIDILSETPHTSLTFCQNEATGKCFAYKLAYLNNEKKGDKI